MTFGLLRAILAVCMVLACAFASAARPNIVFILADDLGWGDLASYGHPYARTPNLDRLAAEGTQFRRFYVAGVTCHPSRKAFMTSRSPASFPNREEEFHDRTTITGLLRDEGYQVGHFGKWHIGKKQNNGTYGIHEIEVIDPTRKSAFGRDAGVFESAIAFISANHERPFYVNVWAHTSHAPISPPPAAVARFADLDVDEALFANTELAAKFETTRAEGADVTQGMREYLADVSLLDYQVGLLLGTLDELGIAENTLVVFTSDQGPGHLIQPRTSEFQPAMLGHTGPLRGSKHLQTEGGVRTPFILRWPGHVPAGKDNTGSIFSALDWLPTLCSAAIANCAAARSGFPMLIEGEDVYDIWSGSDRSRINPLFWSPRSPRQSKVSVLQGNWKYHGSSELYDLATDPGETTNIRLKHPKIAHTMAEMVEAWRDSLRRGDMPAVIGPALLSEPNSVEPARTEVNQAQ